MRKLTISTLCFLSLFVFFTFGYGQDKISEEKKQLISELIVLTKTDKNIAEITDTLLASMETPYVSAFNLTIDKRNDLSEQDKEIMKNSFKDYFAKFSTKFRARLPQAVNFQTYIENSVYPLYDKFFTVDELKDLINFYKTPTGKKVIDTMPLLYKESAELAQKNLLPDLLKLLDALLQEDLEELQAKEKAKN